MGVSDIISAGKGAYLGGGSKVGLEMAVGREIWIDRNVLAKFAPFHSRFEWMKGRRCGGG